MCDTKKQENKVFPRNLIISKTTQKVYFRQDGGQVGVDKWERENSFARR